MVVALGQIAHLDRPAMARAWEEWRQHPTVESHLAFERQQRITKVQRWAFSAVVFAVLAGATLLLYRIRQREPLASGEERERARPGRGTP